ncbi:MAG: hypothetical protein IPL01_17170 [Acidobacteria bacterium]|nr:hypothetical protein [Acidobacteriota bacterium]
MFIEVRIALEQKQAEYDFRMTWQAAMVYCIARLPETEVLALTVESQCRSASSCPISLTVPNLDASDPALVAGKVDGSRPAVSLDAIPNLDIGIGAVFEVDYHSLKFNGAASNFQ